MTKTSSTFNGISKDPNAPINLQNKGLIDDSCRKSTKKPIKTKKTEICHVCKKEKKPYIVFMNMDLMNMIHHDMAREKGPICERCDSYFAMTLEFRDPTDEEFKIARESTKFARDMLAWWTKDKDFSKQPADDYMDPEPEEDKRSWGGTHDIAKWYREKYSQNVQKTNQCIYCMGEGVTQPVYLDGDYEDCSHCSSNLNKESQDEC